LPKLKPSMSPICPLQEDRTFSSEDLGKTSFLSFYDYGKHDCLKWSFSLLIHILLPSLFLFSKMEVQISGFLLEYSKPFCFTFLLWKTVFVYDITKLPCNSTNHSFGFIKKAFKKSLISPSITACTLPVSCPVRTSFTNL
jgi:hypothetical protein